MKLLLLVFLVVSAFCGGETEENAGLCELCTYVVGYVEKFVAENKTETEIEKLFEHVCGLLPKRYKDSCDEIVEEYLPFIINFVEEELPAKKICQLLDLCPKNGEVEKKNDECTMCKTVIAWIEEYLAQNKTEEQIIEYIEKICKLLPEEYKDLCNSMVEEYLPTILDYLEQLYDAEEICKMIGLCEKYFMEKETQKEEVAGTECEICKIVVEYAEKFLDDKTEEEIENLLKKVCELLPESYKELCKTIVEEYIPTIIEYLKEEFPPEEICGLIGLCEKKIEEQPNDECSMCKLIVDYVESFVAENKTEEEIIHLVEKVCTMLPNPYKTFCDTIAENYIPVIIDYVEQLYPADVICKLLGLCSTHEEKEEEENNECEMCELVVGYVESFVAENKTEEEIINLMEKACAMLPETYKNLCDEMVEQYLPTIIDYVEQLYPADVICKLLGLCAKKEEPEEPNDECSICKILVGYVEDFVAQNKTEMEIIKMLEQVCALMPEQYKNLCDTMVEEYLPTIIDYLEQLYPAETICKLLGLCARKEEKENDECSLCTVIVGYVEDFIAQNKTEEEIIKLLEQVCSLLPEQYKDLCDTIVEEYLPTIIDYLEQLYPADVICKLLGLCGSEVEVEVVEEPDDELCEMCEYAVKLVDTLLKSNKTVDEIEELVKKFCGMLPGEYKTECEALVDNFLPSIIEWLESEDPKTICQLIGFCSSAKVEMGTCDLCKWAATMVEKYIQQNQTEEWIMKEMDVACDLLPSTYKSLCKTMVAEYLPTIIDYIEQEYPPEELCQLIGLCEKDDTVVRGERIEVKINWD